MTDTKHAIEAAAEAVAKQFGGDTFARDGHVMLNTEDWPVISLTAISGFAILAWLEAIAQDEASVEAVAREIWHAEFDGATPGLIVRTHYRLIARAVLAVLLSRAKEQKP